MYLQSGEKGKDFRRWLSPVKEFVVDVLGSLHICTHGVDDLNQLLQLLLQRL